MRKHGNTAALKHWKRVPMAKITRTEGLCLCGSPYLSIPREQVIWEYEEKVLRILRVLHLICWLNHECPYQIATGNLILKDWCLPYNGNVKLIFRLISTLCHDTCTVLFSKNIWFKSNQANLSIHRRQFSFVLVLFILLFFNVHVLTWSGMFQWSHKTILLCFFLVLLQLAVAKKESFIQGHANFYHERCGKLDINTLVGKRRKSYKKYSRELVNIKLESLKTINMGFNLQNNVKLSHFFSLDHLRRTCRIITNLGFLCSNMDIFNTLIQRDIHWYILVLLEPSQ